MDKVNIKPEILNNEQTIFLQGELPEQEGGTSISINGNIKAPGNWIAKNGSLSDLSYVKFDLDENKVTFSDKPESTFPITVVGRLTETKWIEELGINNSGSRRKPKDLADKLRQILFLSDDREALMQVISSLKKFSFKFKSEGKSEKENSGRAEVMFIQEVESSIKRNFALKFPPYKGEDSVIVPIEIVVEADGHHVWLWLESLTLMDILLERKEQIFEREEERFEGKTTIIHA